MWKLPSSHLGKVLSYDKLHMFDLGVWGGHTWPVISAVVSHLSREKQAAFETR